MRHNTYFENEEEEAPEQIPTRRKVRKRFGVRTFYADEIKRNNEVFGDWITWHETEKARDQAYDKAVNNLERIKSLPEDKRHQTIGCIYTFGDTLEKVER